MSTVKMSSPKRARGRGRQRPLLMGAIPAALLLFVFLVYPADAQYRRWIDVRGVSSFRDMGGYPAGTGTVKKGIVFRSGDLSNLSAEGVAELRRLGVVTIVDLRAGGNVPSGIEELSGTAVTVRPLPMRADPLRDRNDYYKRMIVNSRDSLIGLLTLLADKKNLPMVIFDEDGINEVDVAAQFILLTAGVSGPDVVSEYLLSNERGAGLKREWGEIIVRYFDEYGGMDYYTTKILGLSSDQIGRIRENLITQ